MTIPTRAFFMCSYRVRLVELTLFSFEQRSRALGSHSHGGEAP
jgi:hypothetical protein